MTFVTGNVKLMEGMTPSLNRSVIAAVTGHTRDNVLHRGNTLLIKTVRVAPAGVSHAVVCEAFGALSALQLVDIGNGRYEWIRKIDESVIPLPLGHRADTAQVCGRQLWDERFTPSTRRSPK